MMRRVLVLLTVGALAPLPLQYQTDRSWPNLLVIDLDGNGINFTSAAEGVHLSLDSKRKVTSGWTLRDSDDSFVVYDQTRNGNIDGLFEMLGGVFAIGPSDAFEYLRLTADGYQTEAEWQKQRPATRRSDGVIDGKDFFISKMILWTDRNHNGISEEDELQSLPHAGFVSIDLRTTAAGRADANGNVIVARSTAVRRLPNQTLKRLDALTVRLARGS
jgi:hypothetical protein